jgi:hypothetical protein
MTRQLDSTMVRELSEGELLLVAGAKHRETEHARHNVRVAQAFRPRPPSQPATVWSDGIYICRTEYFNDGWSERVCTPES